MKRAVRLAGCGAALLLVWSAALSAANVYEVYRVQPGDTVDSIAQRFSIASAELRSLNPHLLTGTLTENELLTVVVDSAPQFGVSGPVGGVRKIGESSGAGANGAGGIRSAAPKLVEVPREAPAEQAAAEPTAPAQQAVPAVGGPAVAPQPQPTRSATLPAVNAPSAPVNENFAVNGLAGRQGHVVSTTAPIYHSPSSNSPLYSQVSQGTKLVVTRRQGDWYGVQMVNQAVGWVKVQFVKLEDVELVHAPATPAQQAAATTGSRAIQEAYRYLGVRYVWGGNGFGGIDCSGLVQQCYRKLGRNLPRVSRDQYNVGQTVPWDQLQPGDRIYFASNGQRIDHTGMYIGNGQFIHASGKRRMVCIDSLYDPRYWSMFVGAKR